MRIGAFDYNPPQSFKGTEMNTNTNVTKITPAQLPKALELLIKAKIPVFVWGSPGIGKSAVANQLAINTHREVYDVRASQLDALDTRGLPIPKGGKTTWLTPDFWPSGDTNNGIILLDELNSAPPSVLAALYQLILDRRLGDYRVPQQVDIIACGNLETDKGVTTKLPTPLANRFSHLFLEASTEDWTRWALPNNLPIEVIAFIRFRPELLHAFDPKSGEKAFPTPRSWEFLSKVFDPDMSSDLAMPIYSGIVGQGTAIEFLAFLDVFRKLPDIDGILCSPRNAPIPRDPSALYAVCGALASKASPDCFDRIYAYAKRLPREFTVLLMRDAVVKTPELTHTEIFVTFGVEFSDVLT